MKTSIDKLRSIVNWANYQSEGFNDKLKSITDIEKVYDYCKNSKLVEFLDTESLMYLDKEDYDLVVKEVSELLGYSVF